MVEMRKVVAGKKFEKAIALTEDVQSELGLRAWEIALVAEAELFAHKQDGHARILIEQGDVDRYVSLDDNRGQNAALSIEFGRAGFIDPETGQIYGRMEGLYILTNAAKIKRKTGMRVPKVRKRRFKKGG